jgi:2-oxo-4-hydroxy-4-carboxy-5-ureidoimidazoline decarboxylase
MPPAVDLASVNALDRESFVALLGGIFEHSPWIAAAAHDARPFASIAALHAHMVGTVRAASTAEKLRLLQAHPELAGKEAKARLLGAASAAEQAGAGLDRLGEADAARFDALNAAYGQRFGFPFIIAVRGQRDRQAILKALEARSGNSVAVEIDTALDEVAKIAWFRLSDLIAA